MLRRPGDVFHANPKEIPALLERGLVAEHPEPVAVDDDGGSGEPDASPDLVDLSASTAPPESGAAAAASTEP